MSMAKARGDVNPLRASAGDGRLFGQEMAGDVEFGPRNHGTAYAVVSRFAKWDKVQFIGIRTN